MSSMRPSPSSGKLGDIFLKVKKDSLRAVEGPLAEVLNLDLETDREFPVGLKVVFLIGLAVKVEGGVFPFIPAKEALKAIEDLKAILPDDHLALGGRFGIVGFDLKPAVK